MSKELKEIALLFFKLGCIAFGGPASHIVMMEYEVVTKRKWMTQSHFLDLIGTTNLIPGPNSTEMTMHCGYERGGYKGLLAAGVSFIFPAVVITAIFAWLYQTYGNIPSIEPFIYGIKPAVIAIILMAGYKLGKKAIKSTFLGVLGVLAIIACFFGLNAFQVLILTGILGLFIPLSKKLTNKTLSIAPLSFFLLIPEPVRAKGFTVFLIFLKIGAILYGSGYVLFAFLDHELVSTGLLSRQELLDAVAVGQMTPGPVLSTATFIGWQLNSFSGAILATLGIFLPSFVFVALLNPIIPKLRNSVWVGAFLNAVNIAAVALILFVCYEMGKETLIDWKSIFIALLSAVIVFMFKKVNPAFIVIGGAFLGYLFHFV